MILLNKFMLCGKLIRNDFLSENYKFSPYQISIDSETNKLKFLYYKNAYIYDGQHTIKYCLAKQFKFVIGKDISGPRIKTWINVGMHDCGPFSSMAIDMYYINRIKSFIDEYKKYYVSFNP